MVNLICPRLMLLLICNLPPCLCAGITLDYLIEFNINQLAVTDASTAYTTLKNTLTTYITHNNFTHDIQHYATLHGTAVLLSASSSTIVIHTYTVSANNDISTVNTTHKTKKTLTHWEENLSVGITIGAILFIILCTLVCSKPNPDDTQFNLDELHKSEISDKPQENSVKSQKLPIISRTVKSVKVIPRA